MRPYRYLILDQETKEMMPGFRDDFHGMDYTISFERGSWLENTSRLLTKGILPQSLSEAALIRTHLRGRDYSEEYQQTRTVLGVVRQGRTWIGYPYDAQIPELSQIVAMAGADIQVGHLDLDLSTPLACKIIESGHKRMFTYEQSPLCYHPLDRMEYPTSFDILCALLGKAQARAYVNFLQREPCKLGHIFFEMDDLDAQTMRVRPCGLGGREYEHFENIDAESDFNGMIGRMRGVVAAKDPFLLEHMQI